MARHTALITGGSRGIGLAIAKELASIGYDIFLTSKNEKSLKDAAEQIRKLSNAKVEYLMCDLSNTKSIEAFHKKFSKKVKSLDVLVNNAGIYEEGTTSNSSMEKFDKVINSNLKGMFYLTQKLMHPIEKGSIKRIVIVSSIVALDSYPSKSGVGGTLYAISKWALRGWARTLREETRKKNIGVSIIYPGEVLTDMWEGSNIPAQRFIQPEDIASVVKTVVSTNPQTVVEEVVVRPMHWSYDY